MDTDFGPYNIDLMALPSNVQDDHAGRSIRFFPPFLYAQVVGINVKI